MGNSRMMTNATILKRNPGINNVSFYRTQLSNIRVDLKYLQSLLNCVEGQEERKAYVNECLIAALGQLEGARKLILDMEHD